MDVKSFCSFLSNCGQMGLKPPSRNGSSVVENVPSVSLKSTVYYLKKKKKRKKIEYSDCLGTNHQPAVLMPMRDFAFTAH